MNMLFVYPSPGVLGGIETLMVRMSGWLLKEGHQIFVITDRGDHWTGTLPPQVKCVVLGERFRELYYYYHARKLWKSLGWPPPDVIKSFDLGSSWIACQLADIVGKDCKVIAGLYASFLFQWYYAPKSLESFHPVRPILANYLRRIPAGARLVCGMDQVEELEAVHREKCILWPIPLDTSRFEPAVRKPKWGKIVSVGRLCAMKEYNFYMVDVVKELRSRGLDVSWSVHGSGEYEPEMRRLIKGAKLEGVISLEGSFPYHQFWQCLADAYVFIGMGTSILEAAMFKVPNVYAIAYDRVGITYGPVHGIPSGSIGPGLGSPPTLKVVDEIERLLRLSPEDYELEQELNYQHMKPHALDVSMNRFLELVRKADPLKTDKLAYLANYPRWLLHQVFKNRKANHTDAHPNTPFFGNATTPA